MAIFTTFFVGNIGHVNVFYDILERKNAFLGYKNKNFKISKKCHFSKVVNPRFWFKNGRFFQFLFLDNIGQDNLFYDILEQKTLFKAIKKRCSKSRKIDIFQRGLAHGFVPKMAILPPFFFRQYRAGKCFWWYSRKKKRLSRLKKQEVQTVEISHFSKGVNPLIWSNNNHFSKFFFLSI